MPDNDLVQMVLAKRQAQADAARASQDAAAKAARAKPRISDDMASESSAKVTPSKPSVDVNAETRVTNPIDVPAPPDSRPFDSSELNHGVPVESDLHTTSAPPSTAVTESMPANEGPLASKAAAAKSPMNAAAKPLRPIEEEAQSAAKRILGREPSKPPVTGSMEGQPVAKTVDRRGVNISRAAGDRRVPPKVESSNPAPAAEKVMTPEGSVEKVAASTSTKASGVSESMQAANKAYQPAEKIASRSATRDAYQSLSKMGSRVASSTEGEGASLATKAASALRNAPAAIKGLGSLAKGAGSVLDDVLTGGAVKGSVAPYRELKAARAAGTAAKSGVKALGGEALAIGRGVGNVAGGVARGVAIQAAAEGGYKLGTAAKEGLDEAKSNAQSQKRQGANYGLKVSSSADTSEGSNFVTQTARDVGNAVKTAAGFSDPTPDVSEDPTLKAKFNASNKKRIQGLQDSGAVPRNYSRATIKGNSGLV